MNLTNEQLATVLAALRFYQEGGLCDPAKRPVAIDDIATDGGTLVPLDAKGIDALCERLVAPDSLATPDEIEEAREKYALDSDNDIEIDDNARASRGDGGLWVAAWVWLERDDETEEDSDGDEEEADAGQPA